MSNVDKNNKDKRSEDTTLYGEFVPSFNQWTTFENQKKIAKCLEKSTDKSNNKKEDCSLS